MEGNEYMIDNIFAPNLYLEITNKCNMNCGYCYIKDKGEEAEPVSLGDIIDAIDIVNPGNVIFTGGEPMLYPDLIEKPIEYYKFMKKKYWKTCIMTNLNYELDDRKKNILLKMDCIQNTFRPWLMSSENYKKNIKFCLDSGLNLVFTITLDKKMLDIKPEELKEYLDIATLGYTCGLLFETVSSIREEVDYEKADKYMLQCAKLLEDTQYNLITFSDWKFHVDNNMSLHCNSCRASNTFVFDPITKKVKIGCPCFVPSDESARVHKYLSTCEDCDIFDICKMDCERFGDKCGTPKNTIKYVLKDRLEGKKDE